MPTANVRIVRALRVAEEVGTTSREQPVVPGFLLVPFQFVP